MKWWLTFILLISVNSAIAAVFTVTRRSDSGPGSLREALTLAAANGTTEKDYINFNLPTQTELGRTIDVFTSLPDISSNLIIDGTTQPGSTFGISHARVKITFHLFGNGPNDIRILYGGNVTNVEIYGLWFSDIGLFQPTIMIFNNYGDVKIGAPDKGNFFEEGSIGFTNGKSLYFQDNICFTERTGQKAVNHGSINIFGCDKTIIGGSPEAGNQIFGILILRLTNPVLNEFEVSYNKVGTTFEGKAGQEGSSIDASRFYLNPDYLGVGTALKAPVKGLIKNNLFADVYGNDMLSIYAPDGDLTIQGNGINADREGNNFIGANSPRVNIHYEGGANVLIGGDGPGQANAIIGGDYSINATATKSFVVSRNIIYCFAESALAYTNRPTNNPFVKIQSVTPTTASGTATPNATIELFYADCCREPGPRTYFATVTADNNGKWTYTGAITGTIIASATYNKFTSLFSKPALNIDKIKITQPTCGKNNGSIEGIQYFNGGTITWINADGTVISHDLDIHNLIPGSYKLKFIDGQCVLESDWIELIDTAPKIDASAMEIKQPACGQNGSVKNIRATIANGEELDYAWLDKNGNIVSHQPDFLNAPAGEYILRVTGKQSGCQTSYGIVILHSVPTPVIDVSHANLHHSSCDKPIGSIDNVQVTATGSVKYSWKNQLGTEVGTSLNIDKLPPGKYILQVTDGTQCPPVYSDPVEILAEGDITLDAGTAIVKAADCGEANGSITNITIGNTSSEPFTPGMYTYQWVDKNGTVSGTQNDLKNVNGGQYKLIIYDHCGRSLSTGFFTVDQHQTVYPDYKATITTPCAGPTTSAISVNTDNLVKSARWVDNLNNTLQTGQASIDNLQPGVYKLYLTDQYNCETLFKQFTIASITPLQIVSGSGQQTDNKCNQQTGSIKGIQITGGTPPYSYLWVDAGGNEISRTADIDHLTGGTYTLSVTDAGICNLKASVIYNLQDVNSVVPPPLITPLKLCSPGMATISVKNPEPGASYRLYNSGTATAPLDEQAGGIFTVRADTKSVFYISQVSGGCESERTAVDIGVGLSGNDISNAFTPNGDGKNDTWQIKSIENYPDAAIRVFNRYGQKIFESRGYSRPFDGYINGKLLPGGVYYYIINPGKSCNLLSGNLTIIR